MGGTREDQRLFGEAFAQKTGLAYRVVEAWLLHEQPPGSPSQPGSNNWLNIGYEGSGPNNEYHRIAQMSAIDAGVASALWLEKQSNFRGIVNSTAHGETQQAQAIINSPWAESHYGHVSPATWLQAASGVLKIGKAGGTPKLAQQPTGTPSIPRAPATTATSGNPPDHSGKTAATGKRLHDTGHTLHGRTTQMNELRNRHVKIKL